MPKITVLMPVYNSGVYLAEAVESILSQSFRDFEFLIIDDGSSDGSVENIKSFRDKRVKLLHNGEHLGVSATLNKGLAMAGSEYVARMDADDLSEPDRLMAQLELMEESPEVGVCGSWVRMFTDGGRGHIIRYPLDAETIRAYVLFNNPLAHPAVMMRRPLLQRYELRYDPECGAGQDYELWSRCLPHIAARNIGRTLLSWRVNQEGVTQKDNSGSNRTALAVQRRELARLGLEADEACLRRHRSIGRGEGAVTAEDFEYALQWLEKIVRTNSRVQCYPQRGLQQAAAMIWFRYCMNSYRLGYLGWRYWKKASFADQYRPAAFEYFVFLYNYLVKTRSSAR